MQDITKKLLGILLITCAILLSIALITHSEYDNSFMHSSTAQDGVVHNWLGSYGALISDFLIQTIGWASFLLVIFVLMDSYRLVTKKSVRHILLRMSFMVLSLNFLPIFISSLYADNINIVYYTEYNPGGYFGYFWLSEITANLNYCSILAVRIMSGLLFILSFCIAIGVKPKYYIRFIKNAARLCFKFAVYCILLCRSLIRSMKALWARSRESRVDMHDNSTDANDAISATSPNMKKEKKMHDSKEITKLEERIDVKVGQGYSKAGEAEKTIDAYQSHKNNINGNSAFKLPSVDMLQKPNDKNKKIDPNSPELQESARKLLSVLQDFGVSGTISAVYPGPVVVLYEFRPAAGIKSSRIIGLVDDIARSMSAVSARISIMSGKNAIAIELPVKKRKIVYLREILESTQYVNTNFVLPIVLGENIGGEPIIADLSKMPHLLVAGTTGSGKSVAINTVILSLLYRYTPNECKFIMIDPKMLELSVYDGIPHLLSPVVVNPKKAVFALKWAVQEMESRYRAMSVLNVRNVFGYNEIVQRAMDDGTEIEKRIQTGFDEVTGKAVYETVNIKKEKLPYIVVIVDEMADLMLVAGKDVESYIQRLAQMARAAGIHLIMATQRPSVDVITGVIKANFPTRISFQVTSKIDSRTILGEQGAEQLLGMGDMLYMMSGGKIERVHGPFVSDKEVCNIANLLKSQSKPEYANEFVNESAEFDEIYGDASGKGNQQERLYGMANEYSTPGQSDKDETLYQEALKIILRDRKVSTSYIQRCMKIGYNRAASIIEMMEKRGVISEINHAGKREVLIKE